MKIKKAIIPAAGLGTRFLPATKSQPKEMLPIVDKPCIQYLVEEAVASGIKEIIIITGRGKRSIEDYFDHSFELHAHLKAKKQTQALKMVERIEKLAKFIYVRQPFPKGDGDAILCAQELVKDEPFAVLFGDDIWDSKVPPLKQMIEVYEKHKGPVVSLASIPKNETEKYGIAKMDKNQIVSKLVEKPKPNKAPGNLALTGKYIITPELLKTLSKASSKTKDKELRLIDGMIDYLDSAPIFGCEIKGTRFDTGNKLDYLKAVIHFGLQHQELSKDLKHYIRNLDLK